MSIGKVVHDFSDRPLTNSIRSCQRPLGFYGFILNANLLCYLKRKFSGWCKLTVSHNSPSFLVHVKHVSGIVAQEKVGWVHARRVITGMQDKQFIRDLPVVDYPRNSVRFIPFVEVSKTSIPVRILGGSPFPTIVGLINFGKESVYNRFVHWSTPSRLVKRGDLFGAGRTRIIPQGGLS